jgi:gliding motility-associated-like protein
MQKQLFISVRSFLILSILFISNSISGQITTYTNLTPSQLVQNVLLGPGVIASNITYTGDANAIGKFTGGLVGTIPLGFDSGVVMTTGTVLNNGMGPQGPNNSTGAGTDNLQPGDTYLDGVANANTFNAAVLEFDFIPMADSVKFRYVFGTDEYMEYVSGGFADVFAFVLSGVTVSLAPTNIALIPNTSTPVTALNVNANINSQYYVDNENPPGACVQYDGFTTVLTAQYPVQCGETYHIRLAIADALDGIVDAGVFLEAGSFTVGTVEVAAEISYGSTNDSTLYEGCGQACLTGSTSQADTIQLTVGGTAVNGTDFIPQLPSQLIFQPGQDSIVLCIQAVQDNVFESLETLILSTTVSGPCFQSATNGATIYLSDAMPIDVFAGNDTAFCSSNPLTLTANVTGGIMPYTYQWSTGATTPSITVQPTQTTSYIVQVTDPCGTPAGFDTVTVFLPNNDPLVVTLPPDMNLCSGDVATFIANATGGAQPYSVLWVTYQGTDTVPNPTSYINILTPQASGTFIVSVTEGCGNIGRDTISFTVEDCSVVPPNVFTPNSDGTNDQLVFTGLDKFPGSQLTVFNRWGGKVYESSDYRNDWTAAGMSDGTYYYVLNVSDGSSLTGFVTLLTTK